jgi:hypothetical protein
MLLGCLPECLLGFGRIDPGEANFVLGLGCVKHGNRVAVAHTHNAALNGGG